MLSFEAAITPFRHADAIRFSPPLFDISLPSLPEPADASAEAISFFA